MDETDSIPHSEHLNFVDVLKSHFKPLVSKHPQTGETIYPRREYLTDVAAERKRAVDEEARQRRGS